MHAYYIVEEWSAEYVLEPLPEGTRMGDYVDCGKWDSIEAFMEGVLPGTYLIDFGPDLGKITFTTGKGITR